MAVWRELVRRLRHLLGRTRFDRELDEEIQFHLATRADELQRDGLSPRDAWARARREFGSGAQVREEARAAWRPQWLDDFWRDLQYGARMSLRSPGFTAAAVLSLGIGVGANCVMFSIVDAALLRPPRVPHANNLVAISSIAKVPDAWTASFPDFLDLRRRTTSFEGLTAFTSVTAGFAGRAGAEPRVRDGKLVADGFFDVLGGVAERGRTFAADASDRGGEELTAVLSHACWQDDLGADPHVLGTTVRVNGVDFTVVGVMPVRFTDVDDDLSDDEPAFYLPIRAASRIGSDPELLTNRAHRSLTVFGRLKPGVTVARARAEVATLGDALAGEHPDTNKDRGLTVRTVLEFRSGGSTGLRAGALAMALSAIVLLIACANVAGLLTSRAPARAQEMAIRLAIGAGRPRLVRQLLTESLFLSLGGGLVGLCLGAIPIVIARRLALPFDSGPLPFRVDGRVAIFSIALAVMSVMAFALVPAFQATRTDLVGAMKGAIAAPRRRRRLGTVIRGRHLLVAGQVAIALLLLTVTSVIYAGAYRTVITSIRHPGFQVDHLVAMDFDPATVHYKDARATQFFRALVQRLRATTNVKAASLVYQDIAAIRPDVGSRDDIRTSGVWVDEAFFQTLGIPLVAGRTFTAADLGEAPSVAIVNEVLARRYWPGQQAVGRQIRTDGNRWLTIVGVAHIDDYMAFGNPPMDIVFLPFGTPGGRSVELFSRSQGDPSQLVEPIRAIVRELDPDQAVPEADTWERLFAAGLSAAWLGMDTLGAMGVLGLILALVGLHGLIAYEVSARRREIGIRMALGARVGQVVRMVLRQGAVFAICGICLGVALNFGVLKVAESILGRGSETSTPAEPNGGKSISVNAGTDQFGGSAFVWLVAGVCLVTLGAAYVPARRAARLDPNIALRAE